MGGTSVQGIELNREGWGDLLPHMIEIPSDNIEEASKIFAEHGDRIAAVISEPVQGAGGVHMPEAGYLEGLRRLCDQHHALLIFDIGHVVFPTLAKQLHVAPKLVAQLFQLSKSALRKRQAVIT